MLLLDLKIKFYKKTLEKMIIRNETYDKILKVSCKLDRLINIKMKEKIKPNVN